MKRICILLVALAPLAAAAQKSPAEESLESQLNARFGQPSTPLSAPTKPNEIVRGNLTYSGIAVQLFKTDNLLQLFNPAAPAKYGSGEDNVLRDEGEDTVLHNSVTGRTGRSVGWKLFSIRF
jgi:hypothetical protein